MAKRKAGGPVWALMRSTAAMTAGLAVAQIASAATAFRPPLAPTTEPTDQRQPVDAATRLYCGHDVQSAYAEAAAARAAAAAAEAAADLGRAAAERAEAGDGQVIESDFTTYAGDDVFAGGGHGLIAWDDGRVYAGAYDGSGGRNGPGVSATTAGWRYAGQWRDGEAEGPGVSAHAGVQEFAGVRDGSGIVAYLDGSVYAGSVRGGHDAPAERDGPGVLWAADGAVIHDGMWRADQPA
jgi:hypothetical protein